MSRPAAFASSMTGHGGMVIEGSPNVLVNGKPAAGTGHAVVCPLHGPTKISTGKPDVFVNRRLMSRLLDRVICLGTAKPGSAPVDHGKPAFSVGGRDFHFDGALTDIPEHDIEALKKAIESGDPAAIQKAYDALPAKVTAGKGTMKVVDPNHPDYWSEYEITGPGGSQGNAGSPGGPPKLEVKPGGGRLQGGGGYGIWGVKETRVHRYVAEDGSIREKRVSMSAGASEGASFDIEWSKKRKGFSVETPWVFGGGIEDIEVGPPGTAPAIDIIVPPVSADVLLGD